MNPIDIYRDAKAVHDRTQNKEVKRIMKNVMNRTGIEFRGERFPATCSCGCGESIYGEAVILLGTGLIFFDEEHLVQFVGFKTANITIGGDNHAPVDYLA